MRGYDVIAHRDRIVPKVPSAVLLLLRLRVCLPE